MLDDHGNKICEKCGKTYPDHMYHVCKVWDVANEETLCNETKEDEQVCD